MTESYNLKKVNPILSKQWYPTKNGNLTPIDVTPCSAQKAWWICDNNHEWPAIIDSRAHGTGCPYCSGQSVCRDNCLQTKNPKLSKEWHPTKNGNLTPKDITPGNNNKVWWLCSKGHEWQAIVNSRVKGAGCPFCIGLYVSEEKNLQVLNPNPDKPEITNYKHQITNKFQITISKSQIGTKLAKDWHPVKNGNLTPKDVLPYSQDRVWWQCKKDHMWQATVASRTRGKGCPYCAGKLGSKDRNLKVLNPKLAKEWHPTKNGDLTPKDILPAEYMGSGLDQ